MKRYDTTYTRTKEQLDYLYGKSALTFEGLRTNSEDLKGMVDWFKECNALTDADVTFYITSGKTMNDIYGLTGTNAYPDDLNIVSVVGIDIMKMVLRRFELGGRWFDDIVDNNARREKEKGGH